MKKEQKFFRNNTSKKEDALLDVCEEFGNKQEGISCLSLGKILFRNGIMSLDAFKSLTSDELYALKGVGIERLIIFLKMQEFIND